MMQFHIIQCFLTNESTNIQCGCRIIAFKSNLFLHCFRYPFNDMEHSQLFAKISRGHFTIPDCLSSRARCLIRSLLRRDPSERITSEDILFHPWLSREERDWTSRSCDQQVPECSMFDD